MRTGGTICDTLSQDLSAQHSKIAIFSTRPACGRCCPVDIGYQSLALNSKSVYMNKVYRQDRPQLPQHIKKSPLYLRRSIQQIIHSAPAVHMVAAPVDSDRYLATMTRLSES